LLQLWLEFPKLGHYPQSQRFGIGGVIKPPLIDRSPKLNDLRRMAHRERARAILAFLLLGEARRGFEALH
jgi:hypothetical protein